MPKWPNTHLPTFSGSKLPSHAWLLNGAAEQSQPLCLPAGDPLLGPG